MHIKGIARVDVRTKNLAKRLKRGEIAVINHEDLDSIAAQMLVDAGAKAVINASKSCSGRYPNLGPRILHKAEIPILDNAGTEIMDVLRDGEELEISNSKILRNGIEIAKGTELTKELSEKQLEQSRSNLSSELTKFVENTLTYVSNEKSLLLDPTKLPDVKTVINQRHALVVVRGESYKEDLAIIKTYIRDMKPVLIGVDGGADALIELGFTPDIIIGDMDSVSDMALKKTNEIIVHAYQNGKAPGLPRVEKLGLKAQVCATMGTSEDLALLLAHEKGAELIVAVGTHSHLIDFLDKGRKGMSSTFLVRLKIGRRLVDAKGVSKLYHAQPSMKYMGILAVAALFVMMVIIALSPTIQDKLQVITQDIRAQFWQAYTKLRLWEWRH